MVYFLQEENGGAIKIGYTVDIENRVFTLQAGNPRLLIVLATLEGDQRVEYRLHKKFDKYRIRSEWFEPSDELLEFIKNVDTFDVSTLFGPPYKQHYKYPRFNYDAFYEDIKAEIIEKKLIFEPALDLIHERLRKELNDFGYASRKIEQLLREQWPPISRVAMANEP